MGGEMMNEKLKLAWTLLLSLADTVSVEYDWNVGEAMAFVAGLICDVIRDTAGDEEIAVKTA